MPVFNSDYRMPSQGHVNLKVGLSVAGAFCGMPIGANNAANAFAKVGEAGESYHIYRLIQIQSQPEPFGLGHRDINHTGRDGLHLIKHRSSAVVE